MHHFPFVYESSVNAASAGEHDRCPGLPRGDTVRQVLVRKMPPTFVRNFGSFAKTGSGQSSPKTQKTIGDLVHSELCKSSGCPGYPGLGDARAWYEVGTTTTASLMGAQVTKRAFAPFYCELHNN
jgi:hypothetical protein